MVRPTSAAAGITILSTRYPQGLLVAYIVAGLTFSLAVGTLVVVLHQGVGGSAGSRHSGRWPTWRSARSLWVCRGCRSRVAPSVTAPDALRPARWMRRLQDLSLPGAALTGVLTHLPGLIYLAALNAIVGSATRVLGSVLQVVVYYAIWFSLAMVALGSSVYRPSAPRDVLDELGSWVGGGTPAAPPRSALHPAARPSRVMPRHAALRIVLAPSTAPRCACVAAR